MNLSTILNVAAITASLLALAVSSFLALRQSRLMRHANQVPVVIDLFRELRADTFITREQQIWSSLPGDMDPSGGFAGIPEPLRTYVYDICLFYQTVAYLFIFKMIDDKLVYTAFHYRILRTWSSVAPFVRGERAIRGGENTFLNSFEEVADAIGRQQVKREGPALLEQIQRETGPTCSKPASMSRRHRSRAWKSIRTLLR